MSEEPFDSTDAALQQKGGKVYYRAHEGGFVWLCSGWQSENFADEGLAVEDHAKRHIGLNCEFGAGA